jgi:hypothetical protein
MPELEGFTVSKQSDIDHPFLHLKRPLWSSDIEVDPTQSLQKAEVIRWGNGR